MSDFEQGDQGDYGHYDNSEAEEENHDNQSNYKKGGFAEKFSGYEAPDDFTFNVEDSEDPEAVNAKYEKERQDIDKSIEEQGLLNDTIDESIFEDPNYGVESIEVQQSDNSNPLYSASSFEELGLSDDLLQGIYALGYKKPSKIQEAALPILIGDTPQNLIGQSQSGTGKTACFVLSMLNRIDTNKHATQALCVCPTRELARQINQVVTEMGKYMDFTSEVVAKGYWIKRGPPVNTQIIIGTPGKLINMLRYKALVLNACKIFVVDEADVMLEKQGMADQTLLIKKYMPKNVQALLFSATYRRDIKAFALKMVENPNIIHVKKEMLNIPAIKQFYVVCHDAGHKFEILTKLYSYADIARSIVFVRTRDSAYQLADNFTENEFTVSVLTGGSMEADERDKVLDAFRNGETNVLITTNVLARGIDVPSVSLVVNYDIPTDYEYNPDPETYLHRIGRTGRFGKKGVALNLLSGDQDLSNLNDICGYFKMKCYQLPNEDEKLEKKLKTILKH